jgi:hypothetical protein
VTKPFSLSSVIPAVAAALALAASACSAPPSPSVEESAPSEDALSASSYVVNGHALNATEAKWVEFVAKEVVPRLPGTSADQLTMAARGLWWTLKEGNLERGNWGKATSPVGYSLCNTSSGDRHIGPLETCGSDSLERDQTLYGRAWQVGLAGVQVPGRRIDRVEALAAQLYPDVTLDALLEQTAALAGYAPGTDTSTGIVQSEGAVRLSWLLRIPAVGFADVVSKEVVPECIDGSKGYCYGSSWDETRKFAPSKSAALRSVADLARILATIGSGATGGGSSGGSSGGCWSPTLSANVEELACVQSASNEVWYQCVSGAWQSGVQGQDGPNGACASVHPLP